MLKTWIPEEIPEKEELKKRIKEAGEKLYQQQMKLKEHKLPVLVLFEGWGCIWQRYHNRQSDQIH